MLKRLRKTHTNQVKTVLYASHKPMYNVNKGGFEKVHKKVVLSDAQSSVWFKSI